MERLPRRHARSRPAGGEMMSLEKRSKYLVFKFWETMYDICYLVFGNLPVTYDVKHKMNMAYMRYQMKRD